MRLEKGRKGVNFSVRRFVACIALGVAFDGGTLTRADTVTQLNACALGALRGAWQPGTNGVVPVYSLQRGLSVVYSAAEGDTAAELARVFGGSPAAAVSSALRGVDESLQAWMPDAALHARVHLWWHSRPGIQKGFEARLEGLRGVGHTAVDFSRHAERTRRELNAWSSGIAGKGLEPWSEDEELSYLTRLLVAGAMRCELRLVPTHGRMRLSDGPFTMEDGRVERVRTVSSVGRFRCGRLGEVSVIELPTGNDNVVLSVFVPPAGQLQNLVQEISSADLAAVRERLQVRRAVVSLPTWRAGEATRWKSRLVRMRLRRIFNGRLADLSRMDGNPGWLYVADVVQAASIDVTASDHEAESDGRELNHPLPPWPALVDRPFVYLVSERSSGLVLLAGWVVDPDAAATAPGEE